MVGAPNTPQVRGLQPAGGVCENRNPGVADSRTRPPRTKANPMTKKAPPEPRTLAVASGKHTHSRWSSQPMGWEDLRNRLLTAERSDVTMAQWAKMDREAKTAIKGRSGGWIGGKMQGGRSAQHIESRSVLTLDVDKPVPDMQERLDALGLEAVAHPTHTPGRWRVVFPLTRDVTKAEYTELVDRARAWMPGVDEASREATLLMFWPVISKDAEWTPHTVEGAWLNPDRLPSSWNTVAPFERDSMGHLTRDEIIERVRTAPEGERNNTLRDAVYILTRRNDYGTKTEQQITKAAFEAGLSEREIRATTKSAASGAAERNKADAEAEFDDDGVSSDQEWELISAFDSPILEPKELWYDMLPLGALVVVSGRGGVGKSTLDAYLAAMASRGEMDGDVKGPLHCIMVLDEDDWNMDTVPRLKAAKADMRYVHKWRVKKNNEWTNVPSFPDDIQKLREAIVGIGAKVVILDVITSMMQQGLDPNNQADVRRLLNPLLSLAQETSCTIIVVNHWKKGSGRLSDMISGSGAYRDTARCVWMVALDPATGERRITIDKYNRSPKQGQSFSFRIKSVPIEGWNRVDGTPKTIGVVDDFNESSTSVEDIINSEVAAGSGVVLDSQGDHEAVDWLKALLNREALNWKDILALGKAEGFGDRQLRRARGHLGCKTKNVNVAGQAGRGTTLWFLPGAEVVVAPITDFDEGDIEDLLG